MNKAITFGILVLVGMATQAKANMAITCEGIACTNPSDPNIGMTRYEYTIQNNYATTQSLTVFEVGAMDLNPANYSNWKTPSGMSSWVGAYEDWPAAYGNPVPAVMYTSGQFTPHTKPNPGAPLGLPGAIVWRGSFNLAPGATVTFGFENAHEPMDAEWVTNESGSITCSLSGQPMANPTTFTRGYVHTPVPEPATLGLLALGGLALMRRRR